MSTNSSSERPVVAGDDALVHLAALGLTVEVLHRALNHGVSQALEIDDDHPAGSAGTQMYEWATWRLRKELRPHWLPQRIRNVEWTIEPQGRWRIVLMSGDEATGDDKATPHSRYARGREGRRQAKQKIVQPQLVLPVRVGTTTSLTEPGPVSYALLHHFNQNANEVRAELSIPADYNSQGVVTGWYKRIILPTFEPGGGPGAVQAPQPAPTPPIEVRRRRSA